MTQKAVILARGLGTRMQKAYPGVELPQNHQRLAEKGLKALMCLNGRPFIDYIFDSLLRAGLRRICLVVAPDAELMRRHARRMETAAGVSVECAVQDEPLGTADAVLAAEDFIGRDSFVLCNGDNLYPDDALKRLANLEDTPRTCWLAAFSREELVRYGNIAPERAKDFAVVTASEQGDLLGIVEKPPDLEPFIRDGRLWLSMNLYRFIPDILDACRSIRPDPDRGELELTTAVAHMLDAGGTAVRVLFCSGGVLDLTTRADIPAAEKALKGRCLCF